MLATVAHFPFSLDGGDNFCPVVQKVIDLGAKHGPLEAKDLIPNATTISRGVQTKSDAAWEKIIPQILKVQQDSGVGFTTDMWVEDLNKYHFLTVTSHFSVGSMTGN